MNYSIVIHLSSAPQRAIKQRTKEERERTQSRDARVALAARERCAARVALAEREGKKESRRSEV